MEQDLAPFGFLMNGREDQGLEIDSYHENYAPDEWMWNMKDF